MCVAIISQRFDLHHTLISKFCVVMFVMTFAISAVVMFLWGFFVFDVGDVLFVVIIMYV